MPQTKIRRAALLAGIASVVSALMPVWNGVAALIAQDSTRRQWWMIPATILTALFTAIMPAFYFALYRNAAPLRFPRSSRSLSLAAALALSLIVALGVPGWLDSIGSREASTVLAPTSGAWTISDLFHLLNVLSSFAYVLLLVAIFRHAGGEADAPGPVSDVLRVVSKVAVIAWGLWLFLNLLRVVLTPVTYSQLRDYALQNRLTPPELRDVVAEATRTLLEGICLFAAPYIVWRSASKKEDEPPDDERGGGLSVEAAG